MLLPLISFPPLFIFSLLMQWMFEKFMFPKSGSAPVFFTEYTERRLWKGCDHGMRPCSGIRGIRCGWRWFRDPDAGWLQVQVSHPLILFNRFYTGRRSLSITFFCQAYLLLLFTHSDVFSSCLFSLDAIFSIRSKKEKETRIKEHKIHTLVKNGGKERERERNASCRLEYITSSPLF